MKKLHHLAPEPVDHDDNPEDWDERDFTPSEGRSVTPPTPEEDRADVVARLRAKADRLRAEATLNDRLADRIEALPLRASYDDADNDAPHAAE